MLCTVAKQYILQQKCLNKWIGSVLLGTPWRYNFNSLLRPWGIELLSPKISNAVRRRICFIRGAHYAHVIVTHMQITWYCSHIIFSRSNSPICSSSTIGYLSNSCWAPGRLGRINDELYFADNGDCCCRVFSSSPLRIPRVDDNVRNVKKFGNAPKLKKS